jgi:hypothetical protein
MSTDVDADRQLRRAAPRVAGAELADHRREEDLLRVGPRDIDRQPPRVPRHDRLVREAQLQPGFRGQPGHLVERDAPAESRLEAQEPGPDRDRHRRFGQHAGHPTDELKQLVLRAGHLLRRHQRLLERRGEPDQRQRARRRSPGPARRDEVIEGDLPEIHGGVRPPELELQRTEVVTPRAPEQRVGDPRQPDRVRPLRLAQLALEPHFRAEEIGYLLPRGRLARAGLDDGPGELGEPPREPLDRAPEDEHLLGGLVEMGLRAREARADQRAVGVLEELLVPELAPEPEVEQHPHAAALRVPPDQVREDLVEQPPEDQGRALARPRRGGPGDALKLLTYILHGQLDRHRDPLTPLLLPATPPVRERTAPRAAPGGGQNGRRAAWPPPAPLPGCTRAAPRRRRAARCSSAA